MHTEIAALLGNFSTWLTLRDAIVTLSIVASGVNITGIVPQLRTMLAVRSSRGQSPLGWTLAATCSASLLLVNSVGYHAFILATGNLLSMSGCLTAALLARHFRYDGAVPVEALEVLRDAPGEVVTELPTNEFQALADVVLEEQHRRAHRPAVARSRPDPRRTRTSRSEGRHRSSGRTAALPTERRSPRARPPSRRSEDRRSRVFQTDRWTAGKRQRRPPAVHRGKGER